MALALRGKKQVDKIQKIIEDYILGREQMTNLFVLIDCRLEPQKIDLEFMEWLGEMESLSLSYLLKQINCREGRQKIM